ncbi:hypothetical protein G9A89_000939 [Geosiphon pyriformis]|nr:hypothetical protein G9A89_000939 [Geosiphon pyriformis]
MSTQTINGTFQFSYPPILIVGQTGNTLGNLLLGLDPSNGYFLTGDSGDSVTTACQTACLKIDEQNFTLIDTPGLFEIGMSNAENWRKITNSLNHCAYGVKAILFVMRAGRYSIIQDFIIEGIINNFGLYCLDHVIIVFSNCTRLQTEDRQKFFAGLNERQKRLIKKVDNRYSIFPNPDIYWPDKYEIIEENIRILKNFILAIRGHYNHRISRIIRQACTTQNETQTIEVQQAIYTYEDNLKIMTPDEAWSHLQNDMKRIFQNSTKENFPESPDGNDNSKAIPEVFLPDSDKSGCFSLSTQVILENGKAINMEKLRVGDKILSQSMDGKLEFSEVYVIPHADYDTPTEFLEIKFLLPQLKGIRRLLVTSDHHILVDGDKFRYANEINPMKTTLLALMDDELDRVIRNGYISVFTRCGTIIADGIVCSCYRLSPYLSQGAKTNL